MFIGDKLKHIRTFRKMTQKQLGLALGYDEKSADIRIAQYEANKRIPKEDTICAMAKILDVNALALRGSTVPYCAEDLLSILFSIDDDTRLILKETDDNHIGVVISYATLQSFLKEWHYRKQELADEVITMEEYQEWKLNWPYTSDDCGKTKPKYRWRTNDEV